MKNFPNQLKAILVDFDGTFVDSMPALWECFYEFLGHYGIKASKEEFLSLIGPSLFEIVERLRITHSLPGTVDHLYEEYSALVRNIYAKKISPFAHALDVLQKAKNRGIKLAIVTSAPLSLIEIFLPRFTLHTFFDAVITSKKNEPSKPSPEVYLRALRTLGVSDEEAIAIEDSASGISSAYSAGLYVIQFGASLPAKGAAFAAKSWEEIGEALLGYQTHKIDPSFEVKVVDCSGKIELSDVENSYVDELWDAAQKHHMGKLFNGKLLNYLNFEKGKLYGKFVEYKYYIAQCADPKLKDRLKIRPIAISCLCTFKGHALVGKRSTFVTDFPDCFELVPSGGIDPTAVENGKVNLVKQALTELKEEAEIKPEDVNTCHPLALFQDLISGGFEICMHIELNTKSSFLQNGEYSQLKWMPFSQLQEFALNEKNVFVGLSLHIINKYLYKCQT